MNCNVCRAELTKMDGFCDSCGAQIAVKDCVTCGVSLSPGATFCDGCGKVASSYRPCSICGTNLAIGTAFCDACGTTVSSPPLTSKRTKRATVVGVSVGAGVALVALVVIAATIFKPGKDERPTSDVATDTALYLAEEGEPVVRFAEITDALLRIEPGSATAREDCLAVQKTLIAELDPAALVQRILAVPDDELAELWLNDQAARIDTLSPCIDSDWAAMTEAQAAARQLGQLISTRQGEIRLGKPTK